MGAAVPHWYQGCATWALALALLSLRAQCSSRDLLVQEEMSDLQAWCVHSHWSWEGAVTELMLLRMEACAALDASASLSCPVLCFDLLFLILL